MLHDNPHFSVGSPGYRERSFPAWLTEAATKFRDREGHPPLRNGSVWSDRAIQRFFHSDKGRLFDHEFTVQYGGVEVFVTAPYHDVHEAAVEFAKELDIELLTDRGEYGCGYLFAFGPKGTPKPCPCCSSIPTHTVGDRDTRQADIVSCQCGLTMEGDHTPYEALNAWNKRTYLPNRR